MLRNSFGLGNGKSPLKLPKFIHWATTDLKLGHIKNALGIQVSDKPRFASALYFEVYKTPENSWMIRTSIDEEPIELSPTCGKDGCPLEEFLNYLNSLSSYRSLNEACGLPMKTSRIHSKLPKSKAKK